MDDRTVRIEKWINEHGCAVLRMCCTILADTYIAQDAMQDTFICAFKKMDSLKTKNERAEKAWLLRIAINVCRDYTRTGWFRNVDRKKPLSSLLLTAADADPQDKALTYDVMRLPLRLREPILLYYYQGMTLSEVGSILGITHVAVKKRLDKAKSLLRQAFMMEEM